MSVRNVYCKVSWIYQYIDLTFNIDVGIVRLEIHTLNTYINWPTMGMSLRMVIWSHRFQELGTSSIRKEISVKNKQNRKICFAKVLIRCLPWSFFHQCALREIFRYILLLGNKFCAIKTIVNGERYKNPFKIDWQLSDHVTKNCQ